jgi:hypothetical protein
MIRGETAGDPVPESVPKDMGGAATEGLDDAGHIGGKIVERGGLQRTLAASDAPHIDGDCL